MKPLHYSLIFLLLLFFFSCKKKVQDKTAPVITLNGSDNMQIDKGTATADPGATAHDDTDGDLSSQIQSDWNSKVNINATGQYAVTYLVTDKSGNQASKTRNVTVQVGSASLLGVYSTTWTSGGQYTCTCSIVPANSADQFTVLYYLGPGGDPFTVQRSGTFGDQLTVNQQFSQTLSLTGTGNISAAGVITLNMTQHYTIWGDTPVSVVMVKQ